MEIWKSQKQRFPDSHRHDDYGVLDQRTINNNSRKSVTYLPGLNCYLCPGLYKVTREVALATAGDLCQSYNGSKADHHGW